MLPLPQTPKGQAPDKSIPTRERLVVAAAVLFQSRGFYGVATGDVLKLAGAPRGSLYHHFPGGKADLACAAADWAAAEAVAAIEQLRLAGQGPEKVISLTIIAIAEWMAARGFSQGSVLAALSACLDAEIDERLRDHVQAGYQAIIDAFAQMLEVAGADKATAAQIGRAVVAEIEGAGLLARAMRDAAPLHEAKARLLAQIQSLLSE